MFRPVFYKKLLIENFGLTPVERIIYSHIVSQSLYSLNIEVFNQDSGRFDQCAADSLDDEIKMPDFYFDEYNHISCGRKMFREFPIGHASVSRAIKVLDDMGLIDISNKTVCHYRMYKDGYFRLEADTGLVGELLIFYSFLKDVAKESCVVYAKTSTLASMYNTSEKNIRNYLYRLKNVIKREENGNIILF